MSSFNGTPSMEIQQEIMGKCQIFHAKGQLIYQTVQNAKEAVRGSFVETDAYILDFTKTTSIDSTGFGFIFSIIKRKPQGSPLVAVVADPFLRELFGITKLDQLLTLADSLPNAFDMLKIS